MNTVLSDNKEDHTLALQSIKAGASIGSLFFSLKSLDPLELRILLGHILNLSRVQLITRSEQVLTSDEAMRLHQLLLRRLNGEPIAYLTGEREFYGLPFYVTPAVLIPRPETELLVELAIERLPQNGSLLDMGTGSGALAVAIARARPDAIVTAVDISAESLVIARKNAERNLPSSAKIRFLESDWYTALRSDSQFDIIVANPPYIALQDVHLSQGDLRFEPQHALTDHADGLSALRKLADGAEACLKTGGWLLMEHGYNHASAVRGMLIERKMNEVQSWCDLADIERVSGAKKS